MSKRKKSEVIHFRATSKDRQRLERMASECGMNVSEMIRMLLSKQRIEVTTIPDTSFDVSIITE